MKISRTDLDLAREKLAREAIIMMRYVDRVVCLSDSVFVLGSGTRTFGVSEGRKSDTRKNVSEGGDLTGHRRTD